ncbi:MAG: UPF0158 family protein [Chlamydiae bacterium]|nr:UPF0158 family protein [Chlamydiota bacterium]
MENSYPQAQSPILLRFQRLMDAFAKSDDEKDFYLDRVEGFIVYVDLEKSEKELTDLEHELLIEHADRYHLIPKMTFYETKKFMEGFVNEKVYDIDTKDKLLDIIQAKEARENFLEFIYDHPTELEKWQQFYQERSRIRIIEWLRSKKMQFVFEEDLDFNKGLFEKVKRHLFDVKAPKDVLAAREVLVAKSKVYYSNEALNPRPKRGRPPKQVAKAEIEPQAVVDLYTTIPLPVRPFLYLISSASAITFSRRFDTEDQLMANLRGSQVRGQESSKLLQLAEKLDSLQKLSRIVGRHVTETGEGSSLLHAKKIDKESNAFFAEVKGLFKESVVKEEGEEETSSKKTTKKKTRTKS